jgi:hypothetical protein
VSFFTACLYIVVCMLGCVMNALLLVILYFMTIIEPSEAVLQPGTPGLGQSNPGLIQV